MSQTITITLPDGDYCMRDIGKPCIFARYTRKWDAYNCAVYNRILKGGKAPRKCRECKEVDNHE